jgi:hypothetical protein
LLQAIEPARFIIDPTISFDRKRESCITAYSANSTERRRWDSMAEAELASKSAVRESETFEKRLSKIQPAV